MGKYNPSRCKFWFEIVIHGLFCEVANCNAGRALIVSVEMVHLNPLNGTVGTG
jgi:hypothetical protein